MRGSAKVRKCESAKVGRWLATSLAFLLVLGGCKRHEKKPFAEHITQAEEVRDTAERIRPGPDVPDPEKFRGRSMAVNNPYEGDAKAIQEGRRMYAWMNCKGCHAEGGGGIGPILWDDQWRYGGRGIDIAESILFGRPDGMPSFAGRIPDTQVWKLVAYVRTLGSLSPPTARGARADHMMTYPESQALRELQTPKGSALPPGAIRP